MGGPEGGGGGALTHPKYLVVTPIAPGNPSPPECAGAWYAGGTPIYLKTFAKQSRALTAFSQLVKPNCQAMGYRILKSWSTPLKSIFHWDGEGMGR